MKIKELRKNNKETQQEISDKLKMKRVTYGNYENELTQPTIKDLIKLADYFNVSLDYLCDRPFNNNIGYIPEDRKEIIKQICELDNVSFNELKTFLYGYIKGKENSTNFNVYKK